MISKTLSGFHPLAWIITERFYIIKINKSNNYHREETKEECRKETTQNKANDPLISLQRDN